MSYLKFILILVIFFNASCSQKIQKTGLSSVKINEIKIDFVVIPSSIIMSFILIFDNQVF